MVGGEYVKKAKIGRAVMDADVFISLSHFKCHESTGFGGTIKNIGMGCGSRAGKMEQHNSGKPDIDQSLCRGCHACTQECGQNAIYFDENNRAHIDHDKCVGCGRCLGRCNFDAIYNENASANDDLNRKMTEYAKAVVDGRPQFHISLIMDVSPFCDCHPENDVPILPDIGMLASKDPVALDQACADLCCAATPLPNSRLTDNQSAPGFVSLGDPFRDTTPESVWESCLAHAEKIGLGSRTYELVKMK